MRTRCRLWLALLASLTQASQPAAQGGSVPSANYTSMSGAVPFFIYGFALDDDRTIRLRTGAADGYLIHEIDDVIEPVAPAPSGVREIGHSFVLTIKQTVCDPRTGPQPKAINSHGVAVGHWGSCTVRGSQPQPGAPRQEGPGWVYDTTSQKLQWLEYPGARLTIPAAINDAGQVAGVFINASGGGGVFLYQQGGFSLVNAAYPSGQALAMNNHGEILGVAGAGGEFVLWVATPPGRPPFRFLKAFAKTETSPAFTQTSTAELDPNLPVEGGEFAYPGGKLYWGTTDRLSAVVAALNALPNFATATYHYMGYDARGSWFGPQPGKPAVLWNRQQQKVSLELAGLPKSLRVPSNEAVVAAYKKMLETRAAAAGIDPATNAAVPAKASDNPLKISPAQLAGPHGEGGKISRGPDGVELISYTVINPGNPNFQASLKVTRPRNLSPPGLPQALAASGDVGSWVFIGEGAQAQYTALITLYQDGMVWWQFMPVESAQRYLTR